MLGRSWYGGWYFWSSRSDQPSCIPVPVIERAELCHIIKLSATPGRCLDFWWELLTHAPGLRGDFINTIVKHAQMSCAGVTLGRLGSLGLIRQGWRYQSQTPAPPTGTCPSALCKHPLHSRSLGSSLSLLPDGRESCLGPGRLDAGKL